MKRLLINALVGTSLLMCVATVVLWVSTYYHCIGFEAKTPQRIVLYETVYGGLQYVGSEPTNPGDYSTPGWFLTDPYPPVVIRRFGGFGAANPFNQGWRMLAIDIPIYPMTVLFSFPPLVALYRRMRTSQLARRDQQGRCASCDYDLRATPKRCPECGRVVSGTK
jgi:hypothetical protein